MKPRPYLPEPNSLVATALLLVHAAGAEGVSSSDLARGIDRESNVVHGLVRQAVEGGVMVVRHIAAPNARGAKRRLRRYIGTPALQRCIDHIRRGQALATRPAAPSLQQPVLDRWLRNAAAYIPRIPQAGWRHV